MVYEIIAPPPLLKNYVKNFWILEVDYGEQGKLLKLFADGYPRINFQCNGGNSYIQSEDGSHLAQSFLSGLATGPVSFNIRNYYSHIAVSLYPHAVKQLFGIRACEIVDLYPNLDHFCPRELTDNLINAANYHERLQLIIDFLTIRLYSKKILEDPVIDDCLFGHQTDWTLNGILRNHRISARHLERKFKSAVGVSPKTWLRIMRFERAMKMLQGNAFVKLSNIARELGYYDHAHFTKDFRLSAGFTPREYLAANILVEYGGSFVEDEEL
jgi:AraC-like DNA-binding protein